MTKYESAISAKNIKKIFSKNNIKALKDFNIEIPKGSIYGLLGPNGAGKSTFINILGGLVKKDSGTINICGINSDNSPKETRKKIGIVPQELNIDPFFTPYELLELQAGLYGVRKKDRRTDQLLERVELKKQKNSYARTLSGGMRRRLLIAKALVHNPEIVILDEPTAGVDVELRKNLWEYVREINKKGTTICLTTHYLEEAEELCDFITIIHEGKIIKNEKKEDLLKIIGKKTVSFILEKEYSDLPSNLMQFNPVLEKNKLILNYDKNKVQLKTILKYLKDNNIDFIEINTQESDLEDVFLELTKKY